MLCQTMPSSELQSCCEVRTLNALPFEGPLCSRRLRYVQRGPLHLYSDTEELGTTGKRIETAAHVRPDPLCCCLLSGSVLYYYVSSEPHFICSDSTLLMSSNGETDTCYLTTILLRRASVGRRSA